MMFHHAVKACVCAASLVLGCVGAYADTYETIRTGRAGQQNDSFFVKGVGFAQLPYELGTVDVGSARQFAGGFSRRLELAGFFRKFNVMPEVSVLEINGIGFQRELEATTVLDAARAHFGANTAGFVFDGHASEPARITLNLGDASVASLSAISVDELQASGDSGEAVVASLPPDASDEQIMNSDAAAEADLQAFGDEGISSVDGTAPSNGSGNIDGSGNLRPGEIEVATGAAVDVSGALVAQTTSGGASVISAELPDDLGAPAAIDVELEPVSLAANSKGSDDGSVADVPVPAAFPLLATVLAGLGVASVRRSRK
jgi:hypothetical protein